MPVCPHILLALHGNPLRSMHRDTDYDVILGCKDSRVRIISGSALAYEMAVEGAVTCVTNISGSPIAPELTVPTRGFQEIVYATQRGQIGQLLVR